MSPNSLVGLVRISAVVVSVAAACFSGSFALAQSKSAEWDKIVDAGRKEGKIVASIPPSAELRKLMELSFTRQFGISVEFIPARGSSVIQRMIHEAKAGVRGSLMPILPRSLGLNKSSKELNSAGLYSLGFVQRLTVW